VDRTELLFETGFGKDDPGIDMLFAGFSHPEDGHTWALAPFSVLRIRLPKKSALAIVVIRVAPFLHAPLARALPLKVYMDNVLFFSGTITDDVVIGTVLRDGLAERTFCYIEFRCPLAVSPEVAGLTGETRRLSFRLVRAWAFSCPDGWEGAEARFRGRSTPKSTGTPALKSMSSHLAAPELLCCFESLGHSCDFGLVQRQIGVEPLGLLRFAGTKTCQVFDGLLRGFAGIGAPETIKPYVPHGFDEYWIHETQYGLFYHTFVPPHLTTPEHLVARESVRLPWLARKLMEDVGNGEKIFLLRRPEPMSTAEAIAVWAVLNLSAPNALLYLTVDGSRAVGAVDEVGPRLLHGNIDGVLGDVAPSVSSWLAVCNNAYRLARIDGRSMSA
jgi:hypothetical protein